MKKFTVGILLLALAFSATLASCGGDEESSAVSTASETAISEEASSVDETSEEPTSEEGEEVKVMTYAEYAAAELDAEVCVETYVQAKQSWWDGKGKFYTQAEDGAYFIYEMPCTEEEYDKLVPGTKIRVKGYKAEFSGEIEIIDATYEILEGSFIATATDVTELLGKDELIEKQNMFVSFKGLTVEKVEFKNGEPGDDIYVTVSKDGASYDFCVEVYLTGTDTQVYTDVSALEAGDVIDVEGFLYWYNGVNTHITSVKAAE